ncbi:MAG: hypothetical protein MUF07_15175 [Steroidobacteraceae bacterium]|jgi:hypothetical protein|nr:hypothetical protein [Steroidobacteraceae bacterium]
MNITRAALAAVSAGFVLFTIGALREVADPAAAARGTGLIATAQAATACELPPIDKLARAWVVTSTGCTDCKQTHLQKGDKLKFDQDVSGEANFSLKQKPAKSDRILSRTAGYALTADGVGNVTGPVVFDHDPLDGSPLDLHWLIVKLRSYDSDGLGSCKLRARVQVCGSEPAKGASSCSRLQHAGEIHLEEVPLFP